MKDLNIDATPKSFRINCSVTGIIEISGCSIVNDPKAFFLPVLQWIEEYMEAPLDRTILNFKIDYIDTASIKQIFEIIIALNKLGETGNTLKINWYYDVNDPEVLELGEILSSKSKLPFTLNPL